MSYISESALEIFSKRYAVGLSPDRVSSGTATGLSLEIAYMVYCVTKHGIDKSDDELIQSACDMMKYKTTDSIMQKLRAALSWMRANIPGIKPKRSYCPNWEKQVAKMEEEYADRLLDYLHPGMAAERRKEKQRQYALEKLQRDRLKGITDEDRVLLEALAKGDTASIETNSEKLIIASAVEYVRLRQTYTDLSRQWLNRAVCKHLYGKEPDSVVLKKMTALANKIAAYFKDKDLPQSIVSDSERETLETAVSVWAAMTPEERKKLMNRANYKRYNRRKGRLTATERNALRRQQREAREEEERQQHQQRQDYKQSHPYCVSHKIRIKPNRQQQDYLMKCFGVARFTYNWMVDEWTRLRSEGEHPTAYDMSKRFNEIVATEYPFTTKVTHFARNTACQSFEKAVERFIKTGDMPKHHRRHLDAGSLHYVAGNRKRPILMDHNPDVPGSQPSAKRQYLEIPLLGYVKMTERLRFKGLLTSIVIKREGDGRWYAILRVYIDREEWQRTHRSTDIYIDRPLGIDLGAGRDLAILSNGLRIEGRKTDEHLWQRKRELQQAIYRKRDAHSGHTSRNQKRLAASLAGVKARIARQNLDHQHKVSATLAYTYKNICMENLNVRDMMNGQLPAHIIKDATLYQFRTLMEQKAELAGHAVTLAAKGYPSSHICSRCGHQTELTLHQRTFRCPECGRTIDRDLNAAINLAKLIGLDGPERDSAANGATTALLTRSGIATHQTGETEQAGCAP